MSKHSLIEYGFAKEICSTFPKLIKELDKTLKVLYGHSSYTAVHHSITAIQESIELMETQLIYYKQVLASKGLEKK